MLNKQKTLLVKVFLSLMVFIILCGIGVYVYLSFRVPEKFVPFVAVEEVAVLFVEDEVRNPNPVSDVMMPKVGVFYFGFFFVLVVMGAFYVAYFIAEKAMEPLREALIDQKRFVSDASHEMRTPLALIRSEAEALELTDSSELDDYKRFVDNAIKDVEHLGKLTSNLLILARFDNELGKKVFGVVSLSEVCAKVLSRFESLFAENKILVVNNLKDVSVNLDANMLEHALGILVENAIKYRSESQPMIEFNSFKLGGNFVLEVKDNGIGIEDFDLNKIFNRFYRCSSDRSSAGFGLGLAIFKEMVDFMGVGVEVKSKLGVGTTFRLKIPLDR